MVVKLANGGTVTVRESGTVEFRNGRQVIQDKGRGSYAASANWVQSLAYGSDVRYVTGR